jgi:hypothetical protein
MKPRIRLMNGMWYCFTKTWINYGLGFSPRDAYLDWVEENR